jgi:SPP1 gp7 family putative phage head morphogenesis protein
MPNIYQQAQNFRRDLETGANNTAAIMITAYGEVWAERIKPEIDSLTAEIEEDIAAGKDPARARLERQARFAQLEQDVAAEMERLRTQFAALIDQDVRSVAERAEREAQDLMVAGIGAPPGVNVSGVFNRLPTAALENITGVLQPGSPLRKILDPLGDDAATAVGKALKRGVALGYNPKKIAREARQAFGGNMARALTVARTETIRAYREASRQTYEANPDIVRQWVWLSARQARTCGVCWAMHGTEHPVDQPMGSHPNCRCTMVPKTRSYNAIARQYGLPPPPEGWPSGPNVKELVGNGADLFDKLSDEDKLRILGPSKFAAFKAGALKLGDLVAEHEDPDWGLVRGEKSLGALGLPRFNLSTVLAMLEEDIVEQFTAAQK